MALTNIDSLVLLDVYDHDTTPSSIKTIAMDKESRFVKAQLFWNGVYYEPDVASTVELIALRPDKVGSMSTGSITTITDDSGDTPVTYYVVQSEITQAMIAVSGTVLLQFKLTSGDQILRTEIFKAYNGVALDGETSEWTEEYQGYNLDELVEKVDFIGTIVEQAVSGGITLDDAILETHNYIDRKINERIRIVNNAIHIST